jgi:hypothetical protein
MPSKKALPCIIFSRQFNQLIQEIKHLSAILRKRIAYEVYQVGGLQLHLSNLVDSKFELPGFFIRDFS